MLWPIGFVDVDIQPVSALAANFTNLARAGVDDAYRAVFAKTQVMIHVDNGWNVTLQQRWFGALTANGVPTKARDVFGVSFVSSQNVPVSIL